MSSSTAVDVRVAELLKQVCLSGLQLAVFLLTPFAIECPLRKGALALKTHILKIADLGDDV